MLNKVHGFVRLGMAFTAILLIVAALFTVNQDIAQASPSVQSSLPFSGNTESAASKFTEQFHMVLLHESDRV